MRIILSANSLAQEVDRVHAQYMKAAQVADIYRAANWKDGLLPKHPLTSDDDLCTLHAVQEADAVLEQLIKLQGELMLRQNPRYAWRYERRVIVNLSLIASWVARKVGSKLGMTSPQGIRLS